MLRRTRLIAVVGTAIALAGAAPASAAYLMQSGSTLEPGQTLVASSGQYELAMQTDGNLVLYWMNGSQPQRPLWDTHTHGDDGARAVLQADGNLVLYNSANEALWASNTASAGCANLDVQNDGNVVIYNSAHAVWSTATVQTKLVAGEELLAGEQIFSPNEQYELAMQGDGNFVLYGPPGALWSTQTNGILGNYAIMQTDGNLVVYNVGGRALWDSKTYGDKGAYAAVQNDGNFVVYAGGKAKWDTATYGRKPSTGPMRISRPAFDPCPPPAPPPPPTTTKSSPDPVVLVPVTSKLPRLRVRVVMGWTWDFGVTRLHRITVPRMPRDASITVQCRGRGCHSRIHANRRHLRRLLRTLDGRRYKAGDRLEITITERKHKAERVLVRIEYGARPRARLL